MAKKNVPPKRVRAPKDPVKALQDKVNSGQATAAQIERLKEIEAGRAIELEKVDYEKTPIKELLEEWILRFGVVRGNHLSTTEIALGYGKTEAHVRRLITATELDLLARWGFEVDRKADALNGGQRFDLEDVISLEQLKRNSADNEVQRHATRQQMQTRGGGIEVLKDMSSVQSTISRQREVILKRIQARQVQDKKKRGGDRRGIAINISNKPME